LLIALQFWRLQREASPLVAVDSAMRVLPAPVLQADTSEGATANNEERPVGELQLVSDDFVRGPAHGLGSDEYAPLAWHSFTGEFEFEIPAIRSIRFPISDAASSPHPPERTVSNWRWRLPLWFLLALTENELTIETPEQGPLTIRRNVLHRIVRLQEGNALVYDGPRGLTGWDG
jgi:hypothetical protein